MKSSEKEFLLLALHIFSEILHVVPAKPLYNYNLPLKDLKKVLINVL